MTKSLPKEITSYDLLKTLAIILMVVDHTGFYFFSENDWWRVAGRLCVPMWFFLIGYAQSRDLNWKLWAGGAILVIANIPAGLYILPLNILPAMLFVRLAIDQFMERSMRNAGTFWAMNFLLFLLALPGSFLFEYGTLGLILANYGYLYRRKEQLEKDGLPYLNQYLFFALLSFLIIQQVSFGFSEQQFMVLSVGTIAVLCLLYFFKPATYPRLTGAMPHPLVLLLRLTGRRTMEIYVLHLLLFKFLAPLLNPDHFKYFDWVFLPGDIL